MNYKIKRLLNDEIDRIFKRMDYLIYSSLSEYILLSDPKFHTERYKIINEAVGYMKGLIECELERQEIDTTPPWRDGVSNI